MFNFTHTFTEPLNDNKARALAFSVAFLLLIALLKAIVIQFYGLDVRAIRMTDFTASTVIYTILLLPAFHELILRAFLLPTKRNMLVSCISLGFFFVFARNFFFGSTGASPNLLIGSLLTIIGIIVAFEFVNESPPGNFIRKFINPIAYSGIILSALYSVRFNLLTIDHEKSGKEMLFIAGLFAICVVQYWCITFMRIKYGFGWGLFTSILMAILYLFEIDSQEMTEFLP